MPASSPDEPGSHDEPDESGAPFPVGSDRGTQVAVAIGAVLALAALVAVLVFVVLPNDDDDAGTDKGTDQSSGTSTTDSAATVGGDGSLDIPTINPSDFPTDVPTDLPTDLPTDGIPTGGAGVEPSNAFSDLPTNPSDFESWFTDHLEQANP